MEVILLYCLVTLLIINCSECQRRPSYQGPVYLPVRGMVPIAPNNYDDSYVPPRYGYAGPLPIDYNDGPDLPPVGYYGPQLPYYAMLPARQPPAGYGPYLPTSGTAGSSGRVFVNGYNPPPRNQVQVIYNGYDTVQESNSRWPDQQQGENDDRQQNADIDDEVVDRPVLPPIPWLMNNGNGYGSNLVTPSSEESSSTVRRPRPTTPEQSYDILDSQTTPEPTRNRRSRTTTTTTATTRPEPTSTSHWISMGENKCQCSCDPLGVTEEDVDSASSWFDPSSSTASGSITTSQLPTETFISSTSAITTLPSTTMEPTTTVNPISNLNEIFNNETFVDKLNETTTPLSSSSAATIIPSTTMEPIATVYPVSSLNETFNNETFVRQLNDTTVTTATPPIPTETFSSSSAATTIGPSSTTTVGPISSLNETFNETTTLNPTMVKPAVEVSSTNPARSKREIGTTSKPLPVMPILKHTNNRLRFYNHCQCWCIEQK